MKKFFESQIASQRLNFSLIVLFVLMLLLLIWTMSGAITHKTQAPAPIGFAQAKDRLILAR